MGKPSKEGAGFEVVDLEKDRCKKICTLPGVGAASASDLVVRRAWKPNGLTFNDVLETCPRVTRERWIQWIDQERVFPDLRLRPQPPTREDLTNMEETCLRNPTPSFLAVTDRNVEDRNVPAGPSDSYKPYPAWKLSMQNLFKIVKGFLKIKISIISTIITIIRVIEIIRLVVLDHPIPHTGSIIHLGSVQMLMGQVRLLTQNHQGHILHTR